MVKPPVPGCEPVASGQRQNPGPGQVRPPTPVLRGWRYAPLGSSRFLGRNNCYIRRALIEVRRGAECAAFRRLRSSTLKERQVERHEHQDNSDIHYQPPQDVVPEEQNVHADDGSYQCEHVECGGCPCSHRSNLVKPATPPVSSRRLCTSPRPRSAGVQR